MIVEIAKSMVYFLMVLLFCAFAFGMANFILLRNTPDLTRGYSWEPKGYITGDQDYYWLTIILYSWAEIIGDFNFTQGFSSLKRDFSIIWCLFMFHTLFSLFIMLNLLVAMMGDTFNKVKECEENNVWKEICGMMVENELLMNRKTAFKNAKYIIVIT